MGYNGMVSNFQQWSDERKIIKQWCPGYDDKSTHDSKASGWDGFEECETIS